jgi:tetratricopeptide (TPR) repeat protein
VRSAADCRSRVASLRATLDFCLHCRTLRAMSGTDAAARARFAELARIVGADAAHPALPDLMDSAKQGGCRSGLQAFVQRARPALERLDAQPLLHVCETLAALSLLEEAVSLADRAACANAPQLAARCGAWAMQLGRYELALHASDRALRGLLQPGLEPDAFLSLVARGAPPEGLLRHTRDAVAERAMLREPIALRWAAARKLGRTRDANLMRLLCLRYFPERASVWATAGNQALDEDDIEAAANYFRCCLRLSPDWTAALAGMAIVLEQQKDWSAALPYRKRVVEVEQALAHTEPASLQRVLRYAAALGRLERWDEAEPLFRHCVALGAYESVPAERPVLVRVFSRALYAPALIAEFFTGTTAADAPLPELQIALQDARLLEDVFRSVAALIALDAHRSCVLRGMCTWLSGDLTRACALLEEAERSGGGDCAVQFLLLQATRALADPSRESLAQRAQQQAQAALVEATGEEQTLYACLTLEQLGLQPTAANLALPEGPLGLRALHASQSNAQPLALGPGSLAHGLRRLTAFRSLQRQRGVAPLTTAALSLQALSELALRPPTGAQ